MAILAAGIATALLCTPPIQAASDSAASRPADVAGVYDGSQTEVAARLELGADGRYAYFLSYGALDERSTGTWVQRDAGVILTSDPSTRPEFRLLGTDPSPHLAIHLDVPAGLPVQLFSLIATGADGVEEVFDFGDTTLRLPTGSLPRSVRLALPMFDVEGDPLAIPNSGTLRVAFVPNDLGFVAFDHVLLPWQNGAFTLMRFGEALRFRRAQV